MNVAGIWRVSGRTYASNEYQYLMHLHQNRDDDEEHNHPADFPLTYITGNDVSHDPDKEGRLYNSKPTPTNIFSKTKLSHKTTKSTPKKCFFAQISCKIVSVI